MRKLLILIFICTFIFAASPSKNNSIGDGLYSLALDSLKNKNYKAADSLLLLANQIYLEDDNKKGIAKSLFVLGYIRDRVREYDKAVINYFEALRIGLDKYQTLSALKNIAKIYKIFEHFEESEKYSIEALKIAKEYSEEETAGIIYNMGNMYKNQNNLSKAQECYSEALNISRNIDDIKRQLAINNQIGLIYWKLEEFGESRQYFRKVLKIASQDSSKYSKYIGRAHHNIGINYKSESQYKEAILSFSKALKFKKAEFSRFISYLDLGQVYSEINDTELARENWFKALDVFSELEKDPKHFVVYKFLSESFLLEDLIKSRTFLKKYSNAWEKYNNVENKLITENTKFEFQYKVNEYWKKRRETDFWKEKKYIILIALLSFLMIILVSLWLWKRNKKQIREYLEDTLRPLTNPD